MAEEHQRRTPKATVRVLSSAASSTAPPPRIFAPTATAISASRNKLA
ncbi:unnamed protein product [Brassica napus]|uniref:(rape) hypothetical protein n=1 Tax=Brassica napus TaxID=3708 RepID=A0A816RKA7_BRANA|nr:unnamed protein product [Brassica napus]